MVDHWEWWIGSTNEVYEEGPFATKGEAMAAGSRDFPDGFYICEASNPPVRLSDYAPVEEFLEYAEEQLADSSRCSIEHDEYPCFDVTAEQRADLEGRMKRACDEWQAAHDLVFTVRTFDATRNNEFVKPGRTGASEGRSDA